MRVLHFLKTGGYSGTENVVITIITNQKKWYGIEGIYVSPKGIIDKILEANQIQHAILRKNNVMEYERVIKKYKPDIIHAHDFSTSVITAFTKNSAKVISHLHNNPPWFREVNFKTLIYQWSIRKFQYVLGVSDSVFEEYVFSNKIKEKGIMVGNPVDIEKIKMLSEEAVEWEKSSILFLGRLSAPKNPIRFIKVAKRVCSKLDEVKVLMIGDGELREECQSLIKSENMESKIKVLGFIKNPYGYLKNTKVLCVTSDWEGFGLVVVEAFALGIPVVATPVGGMKQLVTHEAGLLASDDNKIVSELCRLLVDRNYYDLKVKKARERGKELNNIRDYINKIYELYKNN
uniref:glycosyltransferase n=1 Tax=Agathobacter sp. TaxID=2021311 RepID=UPI0040571B7B